MPVFKAGEFVIISGEGGGSHSQLTYQGAIMARSIPNQELQDLAYILDRAIKQIEQDDRPRGVPTCTI